MKDSELLSFAHRLVHDSNEITTKGQPGQNEDAAMQLLVERLKNVWSRGFEAGVADLAKKVAPSSPPVLLFTYTNWKGETRERQVKPLYLWFGATDWHPVAGWLLHAVDNEKGEERDFALDRIEWKS